MKMISGVRSYFFQKHLSMKAQQERHTMKNSTKFASLGVASMLLLSMPHLASAEEATATLDVEAEIGSAISLTCGTALSFGRTMIDVNAHNGEANVTVASDGTVSTGTNDEHISVSGGTAGECTISGSGGSNGSTVGTTLSAASEDFSVGAFDGVGAASSSSNPGIKLNSLESSTIDLQGGGATFNIGGNMVIPTVMTSDEFGGWTNTVTVTVNDEI